MAWPVGFSAGRALVYDRGMAEVSAFVLAGGRSSRMGTDKAFVEFQGRTLLDRALALVTAITPNVYILGSRVKFEAFGKVVEDEFADHGPLGGIHAALRSSPSELNLILAVDIPFVAETLFELSAERSEEVRRGRDSARSGRKLAAAVRGLPESLRRSGRDRFAKRAQQDRPVVSRSLGARH